MGLFNFFKNRFSHQDSKDEINLPLQKSSQVNLSEEMPEHTETKSQKDLLADCALTIFLWATSKCHTIEEAGTAEFYPAYLIYDYQIKDPVSFYQSLFEMGYYEPARIEKVLNNFKISELKQILVSIGQKTTGRKNDLVKRILDNTSADVLRNCTESCHYYALSSLGENFLDAHYDYVILHQKRSSWNISLEEYEYAKNNISFKNYSFRDLAWFIFNKRIMQHGVLDDYVGIRDDYYCLAQISLEYDNSPQTGAYYFLIALLYDLNGTAEYSYAIAEYKKGFLQKKDLLSSPCAVFIPPAIVSYIRASREYIDGKLMDRTFSVISHQPYLCSRATYEMVIKEICNDSDFDNRKWGDFFKERYLEYVSTLA